MDDQDELVQVSHRSVGLVEANVEDNCIEHGVRGILHHDDIQKMIALYRDEDMQARVHGKFQHLTGLVFKSFSRPIHVIKPFHITAQDFCVIERYDVHPRIEDAVLWVALDRKGTYFVCDELFVHGTTAEMAMRIKNTAKQYRIIDRRMDPSGFIVDQHRDGRSLARELDDDHGLMYLEASKQRTMAIRRIQDLLDYQMVNGEMVRPPQIYFFDTVMRTIWEMEHWQYHEYSGKAAESHNKSEKPVDKDDHMIENLGRAVIDPLQFIEYNPSYHGQSLVQGTMPTIDPY